MSESHRIIASSATTSVEIPFGKLSAPGVPATISIVAILPGETRDNSERIHDKSSRTFDVALLLTKEAMSPRDIKGDFIKEDGGSFLFLNHSTLRVQTSFGIFEIEANSRNELALIRMSAEAVTPAEARNKVYDAVTSFLDHLSYKTNTPILTGLMKIHDTKNEIITINIVGPERAVFVGLIGKELFSELAPVYALYREFKNANSTYYRLLCLFKIMEGIFCELRKKARERAKAAGLALAIPKERVPDHPDISDELRFLVGRPIKQFYDTLLSKKYRDVASHFLVSENSILRVSSAAENHRFSSMTFVCDLCVRVLISNHETLLQRLKDAAAY